MQNVMVLNDNTCKGVVLLFVYSTMEIWQTTHEESPKSRIDELVMHNAVVIVLILTLKV